MIDEVTGIYSGTLSRPFLEFARRQLVNATLYRGAERRLEDRHPMMLPGLVVPVDESNQTIGEVSEVVTRDVATSSIGLFHQEPFDEKRLALHMHMSGTKVNLIIKVIWKGPMGPFFGSAGWYVDKIDDFPGWPLMPERQREAWH